MTFRPLMSSLAVTGLLFAGSIAAPSVASAQTALSGCDPTSGLGSNGQPCVELTPLDPNRIGSGPVGADGADQYRTLDTSTLGQTYACRQVDSATGVGNGGTLLIEDCGTPLSPAELGNLQPYYGTTGAPAPAPVVAAAPPPPPPPPPPAPVYAAPPPPPVVAAPAVGLGNAGLIAAGVGAAALIGLAVVALDDDDGSSSSSTPSP